MEVKYLGRHKRKTKSTQRFGDTFYKLIFQKPDGEKISVYVFSSVLIDTKKWKFIEEERLRTGDILEIDIEADTIKRFGRYEEYSHLLDFKIVKGVWYVE